MMNLDVLGNVPDLPFIIKTVMNLGGIECGRLEQDTVRILKLGDYLVVCVGGKYYVLQLSQDGQSIVATNKFVSRLAGSNDHINVRYLEGSHYIDDQDSRNVDPAAFCSEVQLAFDCL